MFSRILVIGQCSLHWGRMEFGNIGNYYIVEPLFRELRSCFPGAAIHTTMQFSEDFCRRFRIVCLPIDLYYSWSDTDLRHAQHELELAAQLRTSGFASTTTPYLEAVKWADLVIDFSGDIWGDNADLIGNDRLEVGLLKDLVAQTLGRTSAMLAGSPGPFSDSRLEALAKKAYSGFDLVSNRDPISTELLRNANFDISNTIDLACPAFLFEGQRASEVTDLLQTEGLAEVPAESPVVGFIVCGWNFRRGPFDLWPRDDTDYINFAEAVEYISEDLGASVCLMSHANGFDPAPAPFRLKHGRDYPIAKQLHAILKDRGRAKNVFCLERVYDAWQTKAVIGTFDMLVSGRVHAAVAALSQSIPTVIMDYGHEPKAHKLKGFAAVAGVPEFVADPANKPDLLSKIHACWTSRAEITERLNLRIPRARELARANCSLLKDLVRSKI